MPRKNREEQKMANAGEPRETNTERNTRKIKRWHFIEELVEVHGRDSDAKEATAEQEPPDMRAPPDEDEARLASMHARFAKVYQEATAAAAASCSTSLLPTLPRRTVDARIKQTDLQATADKKRGQRNWGQNKKHPPAPKKHSPSPKQNSAPATQTVFPEFQSKLEKNNQGKLALLEKRKAEDCVLSGLQLITGSGRQSVKQYVIT